MIKTIKELLIEWWTESTTTRMPLPAVYTYNVNVDGKTVHIKSISNSRMYAHYKARRMYPNAKCIRVVKQTRQY